MQKWNLLFSSSASASSTLFSLIKNSWLQLLLLFSLNGHWHFRASKAWCWLGFRYDYPSLSCPPHRPLAVCCYTGICFSHDIPSVFISFIYFLTKMKWYQIGFKCVAFVFHELWYVLLQSMCTQNVCARRYNRCTHHELCVNAFHVFYTQS